MTEPDGLPEGDDRRERDAATHEAVRRRRRAAVFGEVLPEVTGDERDDAGERGNGSEEWLRAQVPPHHG